MFEFVVSDRKGHYEKSFRERSSVWC